MESDLLYYLPAIPEVVQDDDAVKRHYSAYSG